MKTGRIMPSVLVSLWIVLIGIGSQFTNAVENKPGNMLLNATFEQMLEFPVFKTYNSLTSNLQANIEDKGRWHLIVGPSANAKAFISEGAACIQIEKSGSEWYSVQLAYLPIIIRKSKCYEVSFRARAEREVPTIFDLACVGGDWWSFSGRKKFDLTPEWQEFKLTFGPAGFNEENARFEFNFGCVEKNRIYFDDVQIVEKSK